MKPVWIVDDDQAIRWVLEKALARAGIPTRSFSQSADVLDALARDVPSALVSDIRMPGGNGLELLRQLKERHAGLPVIVMTAFADLDSTVSAFQGGAFDYLAKPFDVNEAVALIQRAMQESSQQDEAAPGQDETQNNERWMMTQSSSTAMQEVFRAIGRLAQSKVTVLITGESGTGKELVARALHGHGVRAGGLRRAERRGDSARPAGGRAVRPRTRRLHRRQHAAPRSLRGSARRHAVPGRDRRHADRAADPPVARAGRRQLLPRGRRPAGARGRASSRPPTSRWSSGWSRACSARICSTA